MKTRLALVAFKEAGKGPWIRSRGNETGIRVRGLKEGERIVAIAAFADSSERSQILDREGTFDLPSGWLRIRFDKECNEGQCHTHVDLLVA